MSRFNRLTDYGCAALHLCAILAYGVPALKAGWYTPALIVFIALGSVAAGHIRGHKWAGQATTILLLMTNAFCVFMLFPPFTVENGPNTQSIAVKELQLLAITVFCVGLCLALYARQRESK